LGDPCRQNATEGMLHGEAVAFAPGEIS
jgi:hypothetical protein